MTDTLKVLDVLNHTELAVLAKLNDIPGASRAASREQLIAALTNLEAVGMISSPISGLALRMSKWLKHWWPRRKDTAPKKCCPNCSECSDLQILDCYKTNKRQISCSSCV